ncbi:twin-arginine translocase subunit TatC [Tepidibacillus marianensis]|uniref:twin-arginine translocase subunit TatC n=1 Tax=Tepidibacillus marianensis TaxID=3131995 RepID=UPI0030D12D50
MGEKGKERAMTVIGHLEELRKRLIFVIIFFVISLVIGFFLAQPVIEFFKSSPAAKNIPWNVFRLTDALRVYMQFSFFIGLTLSIPFVLFQVWRFISPGLTKRERKSTTWFIPAAFILFLIGISFGYFIIFPMLVKFMSELSKQMGVQEMYGMAQYFGFMFNMIIPFGILFELPVIVLFLTRLGILTPKILIKFRKIAYLILVVIAASITPPEIVSEILVSIPLILLYEISIWLSKIGSRKREKALEASE